MSNKKDRIKLYVGIVCITFFLAVLVLRKFTLYGHEFLFDGVLSDLLRVNYPTYYNLYDNIANGWSFWSWNMGIGTSVLTHADVIFDPFTYIMFIFGKEHIGDMMVWSLVAKLICEGLSISLFLGYFKFDNRAILFASVAYAFSGYSLIMGSNLALGTVLVYFPLILLGIEKLIDEKKVLILIISLLLTCMLSYYFFYVSGILAVFYMIGRSIYQRKQLNVILVQTVLLAVLAVFVIGISAFIILPQLELVRNSARTTVSDIEGAGELLRIQPAVLLTAVLRLFGNDILGNRVVDEYIGSPEDYFQITTYTSTCCLILVIQAWELMSSRQKSMVKGIFAAVAVAVLFPLFSFAMNAFSTINYRWMFFVNILLTVCIAFCIDLLLKEEKFNKKLLVKGICATYLVIFGGMVIRAGMVKGNNYVEALIQVVLTGWNTIFIFSCEAILLLSFAYFISDDNMKNVIRNRLVVIFGVFMLFFDAIGNYFIWFNAKSEIYNYEGECDAYKDGSAYIVEDIQKNDGSGFYRINKSFDSVYDKNGIPSDNDAMVQSYYGLKSYNSLNNGQYITFLQTLGIYVCNPLSLDTFAEIGILPGEVAGQELNYIDGVGDAYDIMGYLGVKYYLSKREPEDIPDYFKRLEQFGSKDVKVYENELYFPLAFVNNNEIGYELFMELPDEQKRAVLMRNTVVYDEQEKETLFDASGLEDSIKEKQNAFRLISFSDDEIELEIKDISEKSYVSFLIPYDKDWNVYIDGSKTKTEKINISLLGARVEGGTHVIKLVYKPSMFYLGIRISIFAGAALVLLAVAFRWKKYSILKLTCTLEAKTYKLRFPNIPANTHQYRKYNKQIILILFDVLVVAAFVSYMNGGIWNEKIQRKPEEYGNFNRYVYMDVKEDVLDINIEDPLAEINTPQMVRKEYTQNLPDDCEMGVMYVYFYDRNNVAIQIVGSNKANSPQVWTRQYTESGGWSEYYTMAYGE